MLLVKLCMKLIWLVILVDDMFEDILYKMIILSVWCML